MQRTLLLAKIHSCTLTAANLDYRGSMSIDQTLLDAAGILVYEQVQVVNITKVERLITYALSAPANSGAIELNGAAARMGDERRSLNHHVILSTSWGRTKKLFSHGHFSRRTKPCCRSSYLH